MPQIDYQIMPHILLKLYKQINFQKVVLVISDWTKVYRVVIKCCHGDLVKKASTVKQNSKAAIVFFWVKSNSESVGAFVHRNFLLYKDERGSTGKKWQFSKAASPRIVLRPARGALKCIEQTSTNTNLVTMTISNCGSLAPSRLALVRSEQELPGAP